ncbi:MAG TPA: FAD-binding oxidoreductase [Solirubrobacteraceae bacterium]|nr:FAD-binding oxidoreductase [Solirubrobacteraceae bacterium]
MRNGELSWWWRSLGGPPPPRPPLAGPTEADVAIVGAGFTGLWTAYHLKRARPSLEIVVLEREHAGFGASGRNGGWVSGFFSGAPRAYERSAGAGSAGYAALQRTMIATVASIGELVSAQRIEADFVHGGALSVALNAAQAARLRERTATQRAHGLLRARDLHELGAGELAERVRVAGAQAAAFSPHVARVQPVKLVLGLAAAVERAGVRIYERTPVSAIVAHEARTPMGAVRARWVVRATEAFTADLPGRRRELAPVTSSMIVTEPLAPDVWEELGWSGCELLDDGAHVYAYLQRTADGRIAIGGRGVPYRFGSRTERDGVAADTVAALRARLVAMFPAAGGAQIEHAWSGVLGVARDWCVSVQADPTSGLASAGGYAGEGVAASNLAARTLRDLILGERSELTALPWVAHRSRRWEPEPLRWAGIRGVYALYRAADRAERRSGRPSRLARVLDSVSARS